MSDSQVLVLFEDESLLILHKPSGMPSVPHVEGETHTAVEFAARHAHLHGIGTNPLEPGLLHRLDTGTSGILVFAKTQTRFEQLKKLWKTKQVRKWYRALVTPAEKTLPSQITRPLGHSAKSSKRMVTLPSQQKIRGKPLEAVTLVQKTEISGNGLWDLTLEIETGVRHQIRCHLAALGCPIVGDTVYKGMKAERLFLHAWRIELPLEESDPEKKGARLLIEARLPENWPIC